MEQIVITHPNGETLKLFSKERPSTISKATQKVALLSDDLVSLTVVSAEPIEFQLGDRITVFGKQYRINQLPEPTKEGERKFTYEVTLEGLQYDMLDVVFKLPEGCYGEQLYTDLEGHLTALIWNLNRLYPGKWTLGTFPASTEYKNLNATGKNCLQTLQEYCSEYGVEYEIVTNQNNIYTLNIKASIGTLFSRTLKYGRGRGLYKLQRKNVNNAGVTTRLYVYGGGSNLGKGYRHTKLCLPGKTRLTSYVESAAAQALYGVKENEKTYEDIKPERVGHVTALGANVYSFQDSSMFDLNEREQDGTTTKWLIPGTTAKVTFQTGNLAGYSFDIHSYDHDTHTFVINKFTDENGMEFPSETSAAFQIRAASSDYEGDAYILEDITLPQSYIDAAEQKLLEKGTADFNKVKEPQVSYTCELDEAFFVSVFGRNIPTEVLHIGDTIHIIDEQIGVDKEIRITRIERNLLKRHSYTIQISDTVTKTTTVRVLNELRDINDVINLNSLADPATARRRWKTAQELLNMVFDPDGDYYSERIKPLSIETAMLSVGAKSQQFVLNDVTFEPNYNGNYKNLRISSGSLVHYAIEEQGVRTWYLSLETFVLNGNYPYYIYAKCSRVFSTASWDVRTEQKKVESDPNYYYFLIGTVSSPQETSYTGRYVRSVSLTYGFSTVNGRFIKTGVIESTAGTCYFDLDNNEIGGVIKFLKTNGTTGYVKDVDDKADDAKDYIDNTLPGILADIQAQLDGQIEQFFETYDPTLSNAPASTWTTTQLKEDHLGDLFYNTTSGAVFRFVKESGVYKWQQLSDAEVAQALALANDALELAKKKRRVFVTQPTTPYEVGDLWVQGETGDILKCSTSRATGNYNSADWGKASKYTDDSALNTFKTTTYATDKENMLGLIDGKIESYFQTSDPAESWNTDALKNEHLGDTWFDSSKNALKFYKTKGVSDISSLLGSTFHIWKKSAAPTLSNAPASSWTNTALKNEHLSDVYYSTSNRKLYFFAYSSNSYRWVELTDVNAAYIAEAAIRKLKDGAKVWNNITPTTPYSVNDVMISGNSVVVCNTARASGSFVTSDWSLSFSFVYCWQKTSDQTAIDAYNKAAAAQDTADGKRRVFVTTSQHPTPYPPYDVGDLWLTGGSTDGELFRCVQARASGSYTETDWAEAVYYDNTKTTIDGGLITSGTVQLVSPVSESIVAGITGGENETAQTAASNKVRIWAGSSKANRFSAPFRVLQDGTVHATKANIEGTVKATDGEFNGMVKINGGTILLNKDGSGKLANNNISWDKWGNVSLKNFTAVNGEFSGIIKGLQFDIDLFFDDGHEIDKNCGIALANIGTNNTMWLPSQPNVGAQLVVYNCTKNRPYLKLHSSIETIYQIIDGAGLGGNPNRVTQIQMQPFQAITLVTNNDYWFVISKYNG